jgi:hypothetical protein
LLGNVRCRRCTGQQTPPLLTKRYQSLLLEEDLPGVPGTMKQPV